MTAFTHSFRVRYSEVDAQAVVFNSRYLEYADVMVSAFFRDRGLGAGTEGDIEFHVARAEVNYRRPFGVDDMIVGKIHVARFGNSSMVMHIDLHHRDDPADAAPRTEIELTSVHIDRPGGSPQRIPDAVRAQLTGGAVVDAEAEPV
ncbi:acyl-CoA thioesterase [Pseudopontixanthobacter vadosimaris]|uniref:acyl-CoA thioesterase n=1 Tax=Pseudopontixanthobacter vadosimaris TaxID=2726450 RepID=UPI0014749F3B|nr:thioesterase family protein [Pseudopontixanthobacter vadosimaris]